MPGLTGTATPEETGLASSVSLKSSGKAVPPLSLVTNLTTVMYACWSLLVMVQVALWPAIRVI